MDNHKNNLNRLFGIKPWKSHVEHVDFDERSETIKQLYAPLNRVRNVAHCTIYSVNLILGSEMTAGNIVYVILFGWWISTFYVIFAGVSLLFFSPQHSKFLLKCGSYLFWPFGKVVARAKRSTVATRTLHPVKATLFSVFVAPILAFIHIFVTALCWFTVIFIPSGKLNQIFMKLLFKKPLDIQILSSPDKIVNSSVEICTYNAHNTAYFKYSVFGMNIALVNLLAFVFLSISMGKFNFPQAPPLIVFFACLLSAIPLAYYIGAAVSSIAAQSTFALGAFLNASFGSVIELILYYNALKQGHHILVQSAVTGTLLGVMLLLPGLSMFLGGLKFKEQFFNQASSGVSSVLLLISLVGSFSPTLFYHIYGRYVMDCVQCSSSLTEPSLLDCGQCHFRQDQFQEDPIYIHHAKPLMYVCAIVMSLCYFIGLIYTLKTHAHIYDSEYQHLANRGEARQSLSQTAAGYQEWKDQRKANSKKKARRKSPFVKPLQDPPSGTSLEGTDSSSSAVTGENTPLLSLDSNSLSTEIALSSSFEQNSTDPTKASSSSDEEAATSHSGSHGGHHGPEWSISVCIVVLLVSTFLFAIIADILAENITVVTQAIGVSTSFLGLTLIAVIPNASEFINAVQFALQDNISLAIEVGQAASVQVALLQIPVLVVMSSLITPDSGGNVGFTMIFPLIDLIVVFFAVLLLNYISIDGLSNYFIGSTLILIYTIVVATFYVLPEQHTTVNSKG